MRTIGNHVEAGLLRGIAAAAGITSTDRQNPILIVEEIVSTDWASATFIGARHRLALRLQGTAPAVDDAQTRLASRLTDWEFRISNHIVADIELEDAGPDLTGMDPLGNSFPAGEIAGSGADSTSGPSTVSVSFVVNVLTILD